MTLLEYFVTGVVWMGLALLVFGLPILLSRWIGCSDGFLLDDGDGDGG
jgi:hypothetical protein